MGGFRYIFHFPGGVAMGRDRGEFVMEIRESSALREELAGLLAEADEARKPAEDGRRAARKADKTR